MIVGMKDAARLVGITIISFCAVFVCGLFTNYYMDISGIEAVLLPGKVAAFYNAQVSTAKVVCLVSGGCLLVTAVIMLAFYIRSYIETHKRELGVLKALGYSNMGIAGRFWIFGTSVFIGTGAGLAAAFILMPEFYSIQNSDGILPEIAIGFHPSILILFVIVPTAVFAAMAVICAFLRLKRPVMSLLRGSDRYVVKKGRGIEAVDTPFIRQLGRDTLRGRKSLVFFVAFAAFSFSSTTQMSTSMNELSSPMMGAMILLIGVTLACTALYIAVWTAIDGSKRTIAVMWAMGYSRREWGRGILGGYRPVAYIGFVLGTIYQYGLLRTMVDIVFRDVEGIPAYNFDMQALVVSLVCFAAVYEIFIYLCSRRIIGDPLREIMGE